MSKNKKYRPIQQNGENIKGTDVTYVTEYSESSDNESIMVPDQTEDVVDIPVESNVDMDTTEEEYNNDNDENNYSHAEGVTVTTDTMETSEEPDDSAKEDTIEETRDVQQPSNFYRVGTDFINGKCVNQFNATTDLDVAKESCMKARNTYKKTYHVFDKVGNVVCSIEYTMPKDSYYRVGTDWRNGTCINQKLACTNIDQASVCANESTKLTGFIHHVYDPSGKIVFSAKKKLILLSYKKRGIKNADWYTK